MKLREPLEQYLVPQEFHTRLEHDVSQTMRSAGRELAQRADDDENGCWGYYPELANIPRLDACVDFKDRLPVQNVHGTPYGFSWLRYRKSGAVSPPQYHLDTDTGIGMAGETGDEVIPQAVVWRLLINMHKSAERQLGYLDRDPRSLDWQRAYGTVQLAAPDAVEASDEHVFQIPPRDGAWVHGVVFCASRLPHAGIETGEGHFLASWSYDATEETT